MKKQKSTVLKQTLSHSDASTFSALFRAARRHNMTAQYRLGLLYEHGEGVIKSAALASHWYERAAKRGHCLAQLQLHELHVCYPKEVTAVTTTRGL